MQTSKSDLDNADRVPVSAVAGDRGPASADRLIADYLAAFRARNTMSEPPEISYFGGWFTFKSPRTYPRKYRRAEVEAMRDNLRSWSRDR